MVTGKLGLPHPKIDLLRASLKWAGKEEQGPTQEAPEKVKQPLQGEESSVKATYPPHWFTECPEGPTKLKEETAQGSQP